VCAILAVGDSNHDEGRNGAAARQKSHVGEREPELRDIFTRMVEYRRHVLAIFDNLVGSDLQNQRLQ
jgi:hypothetical protein